MRLSAYFSQPQFARHGLPVVAALRARGAEVDVWAPEHGRPWGEAVTPLRRHEVAPLVLVASPADADRWRDRALVFVEHGAGQTYQLPDSLRPQDLRFAGSPGLDNVALFLCPSERVADLWRAAYPQALAEVVGCPALDRYADVGRARARDASDQGGPSRACREGPDFDQFSDVGRARCSSSLARMVAITCHWRMGGAALPEADPALPHFEAVLPHVRIDLARAGIELVGHAHPRIATEMRRRWDALGVRFEPDPDVILSTADLLIADSTSLMYEAAAIGLPVLSLNCPAYRRDVHHGLRFWSEVPGLQCDEPADLPHSIALALEDAPHLRALRERAAAYAYDRLDGRASERAADAILTLEGTTMPPPHTQPEIADQTDELVERLFQLGADEEMAASVRTLSADQRERLRRMNDVLLAGEVRLAARSNGAVAEAFDAALPTEDEMDEAAARLLNGTDDEVLEAVGDDADLAARLYRLAEQEHRVIDGLGAIAGIVEVL